MNGKTPSDPHARVLSDEQVARFYDDGWVVLRHSRARHAALQVSRRMDSRHGLADTEQLACVVHMNLSVEDGLKSYRTVLAGCLLHVSIHARRHHIERPYTGRCTHSPRLPTDLFSVITSVTSSSQTSSPPKRATLYSQELAPSYLHSTSQHIP